MLTPYDAPRFDAFSLRKCLPACFAAQVARLYLLCKPVACASRDAFYRARPSLWRFAFTVLAITGLLFAQRPFLTQAQGGYQTYHKISGQLQFEGINDYPGGSFQYVSPYSPITFYMGLVPDDGGATINETPDLDSQGNFTLTGVPAGSYRLVVFGSKWLQRVIPHVDVTASDAQTGSIFLPGGDANHDNSVDSTDFGTLVGAFNTQASVPGSGYDPTADFNCDGFVDSTDFGILIGEFNNVGDSLLTLAWQTDGGIVLPTSNLTLTGGTTNDSQVFTLAITPAYGAPSDGAPQIKCSLNDALAVVSSSGALTNLTTTPISGSTSGLSWSTDLNQAGMTNPFTLVASTVNYPTTVTVTATYQGAVAKITIVLMPTSLWVTDVFMPSHVGLQWNCSSNTGFTLRRVNPNSATVTVGNYDIYTNTATDAISDSSGNPITTFGSGETYTYQLWSQPDLTNNKPAKLFATAKVTPVKVLASENQAADSRLDLRYAQNLGDPHYVDFAFGSRAYRGGLFAGYVNAPDNSRVGRSFAKYNLTTAIPSDKTYCSGSVNAFFTQAYPAPNGQNNKSNVDVLCYNIASSAWSALGDATGAGALVWTNSVPLLQGATLAPGIYPVDSSYNPGPVNLHYTPPAAGTTVDPLAPSNSNNWAAWDMSNPIRQALLGKGSAPVDHHLSSAWTGAWDVSNEAPLPASTAWAYFAKNEYVSSASSVAHGPCLLYALSSPVPVQIQFTPATLADDGSYSLPGPGGSVTCSITMNGVGIDDAVIVPVTLASGGFATISGITDMNGKPLQDAFLSGPVRANSTFYFLITGTNRSFKFTVATPSYYDNGDYYYRSGWATVGATLNGVTATSILRVQGQ